MTLTSTNAWAASGAIGFGVCLILFSPLSYWLLDTVCGKRGWIAGNKGTAPTLLGLMLVCTLVFFATFGILSINWACQ